jgi:hypothetical protein
MIGTTAAVTLLFTGVATYFGALVSQDQLQQSREVTDQSAREKAERISYWADSPTGGAQRLHVMNRSPDPVGPAWVLFDWIAWKNVDTPEMSVEYFVYLQSIAPCSELIFAQDVLRYRNPGKPKIVQPSLARTGRQDPKEWKKLPRSAIASVEVGEAYFLDRSGVAWRRSREGLQATEGEPPRTLSAAVERGPTLAG